MSVADRNKARAARQGGRDRGFNRRDFLKGALAGGALLGIGAEAEARPNKTMPPQALGLLFDSALCIGCNSCAVACPYDQRTPLGKDLFKNGLFGEGKITDFEKQGYTRFTPGTVSKCDFCSERVDSGLDPACVVTCPTDARIFGDLDDPESKPSKLIKERGGRPPMPEKNTKPKVYYVT